jgi:putative acetyltransferase
LGFFLQIKIDDLTHPEVAELLQEHLNDMYASSPAESVHALDLENFANQTSPFGLFGRNKAYSVVVH